MNVMILFNHPYEKSYCHALLRTVTTGLERGGHTVDLLHLDREGFDPVMSAADLKAFRDGQPVDPKIRQYRRRLQRADRLVFIFPVWWELMPARTKGFIDRVVFPGVFYRPTGRGLFMKPLLGRLQGITLLTTMNTPGLLYRLGLGSPVKKALVNGTFRKMGYKNVEWINLPMVKLVPGRKRRRWLRRLAERFASL